MPLNTDFELMDREYRKYIYLQTQSFSDTLKRENKICRFKSKYKIKV